MKLAGMVLIVVGLIGIIWGGISWTQTEQVAELGPIEVTTQNQERLPIPPIAGAACLIAGTALVVMGRKS